MKKFLVSVVAVLIVLSSTYPLSAARTFDRLGPYKDVTIQKITSNGIVIFHQEGVSTIDDRDLSPDEIRDLEKELQLVARKRARQAKRIAKQKLALEKESAAADRLFGQIEKMPPEKAIKVLLNALNSFKDQNLKEQIIQRLTTLETQQVELILSEVTALPLKEAIKKLLQARHELGYAENISKLRDTLEVLEQKAAYIKQNPPESMIRIYRSKDLPELQLNWKWNAGHLLHYLKYEHLREQHTTWKSAISQQRQNKDFFVKELESMHTIQACMIDSDAAIYSISYPPGQSRQYYNKLLNEMLTFYLEKEPEKMRNYTGVERQYFTGYRKYLQHSYVEFGILRVLLLCTPSEVIAADFRIANSQLQSLTVRAVNLKIVPFPQFMEGYRSRSGYFQLDALNKKSPDHQDADSTAEASTDSTSAQQSDSAE